MVSSVTKFIKFQLLGEMYLDLTMCNHLPNTYKCLRFITCILKFKYTCLKLNDSIQYHSLVSKLSDRSEMQKTKMDRLSYLKATHIFTLRKKEGSSLSKNALVNNPETEAEKPKLRRKDQVGIYLEALTGKKEE